METPACWSVCSRLEAGPKTDCPAFDPVLDSLNQMSSQGSLLSCCISTRLQAPGFLFRVSLFFCFSYAVLSGYGEGE